MADAKGVPAITASMVGADAGAPRPDHIRSVFQRYADLLSAGDAEGIVALFASDAQVCDPVTAPPRIGHAAIRDFYSSSFDAVGGSIDMRLEGAVRIAGRHAAAAYVARMVSGGRSYRTDTIDIMVFDDDGKIRSMHAYWGLENVSDV